jgi:hypothetical protein
MADVRPERAIHARDAAAARLRRLTVAVLAGAAGIAGAVAGYAASTTQAHTALRRAVPTSRPTSTAIPPVPAPTATIAVSSDGVPAVSASSSAPSVSYAQPVVVSGGS